MKQLIILYKRHYGVHQQIKSVLIDDEPLIKIIDEKKPYDYSIDENKLLNILPESFLPKVKLNTILLMANGMGISNTKYFHPWGKYFDAYSIEVIDDETEIEKLKHFL